MENCSRIYEEPEAEVNLVDILWDLLSQWKVVLLVALVFAFSALGYKYLSDVNDYQSSLEQPQAEQQQASLSPEDATEQVLSKLPIEDRPAVETLMQQQKLVDAQAQYLSNSLALNSDPTRQHTLILKYLLSSDGDTETVPLADAYTALLKKTEVARDLGTVLDPNADVNAVSELYTISYGATSDSGTRELVVSMNVILPSEHVNTDAISNVIEKAIQGIHGTVSSSFGTHSIRFFDRNDVYTYNESLVTRKQTLISYINTNRTAIKTAVAGLNEGQKTAYEQILAITGGGNSVDNASGQIATNTKNSNEVQPSFSYKYAVAGLLVGIILYTIIYSVVYVTRGSINTEGLLSNYTVSRLFGGVYYAQTHGGFSKLFHSKVVDRLRYGKHGSVDEQIDRIVTTAESVCRHAGIHTVHLLCVGDIHAAIIDAAKTALSEKGLQIASENVDINIDERVLLPIEHAIYLANSSVKRNDMWKISSLARSYDIAQLGCVLVKAY